MRLTDYHVHSSFSDGKNTVAEVAKIAAERGFSVLGFTEHSPMADGRSWGMKQERLADYLREVQAQKALYAGKMEILLGIEQDYYAPKAEGDFDYRIGSVHGFDCGDHIQDVDETIPLLEKVAAEQYGGDVYAMIEGYYEIVGDVWNKTRCEIIGHLDLITKWQEQKVLFDENHPRYVAAARAAIDRLIPSGALFEVNAGAIGRGYRSTPYPSIPLLKYIREKGGEIILTGDTHDARKLGAYQQLCADHAKAAGFTKSVILTAKGREYQEL